MIIKKVDKIIMQEFSSFHPKEINETYWAKVKITTYWFLFIPVYTIERIIKSTI